MNENPRHTSPARSVRLIAFDADDTLWDNQSHFARVERAYCDILAPFGDAHEVSAALFSTESDNMPLLGYGCKAFTISLVETAVSEAYAQFVAELRAHDVVTLLYAAKDETHNNAVVLAKALAKQR